MITRSSKTIGDTHCEAKEYELAIEKYSKEIEAKIEPLEVAFNNRGFAYSQLNDYKNAINDYTESIRNKPCAITYRNRCKAYYFNDQCELAVHDGNELLKLNPDDMDAYHKLGDIYFKQKNYKLAIKAYSKVIEMDAENKSAYENRCIAYFQLNQYSLSIDDCNTLIRLNPNNDTYYANRAQNFNKLGEYALAIQDSTKAITINSANDIAYNARAHAHSNNIHTYSRYTVMADNEISYESSWYLGANTAWDVTKACMPLPTKSHHIKFEMVGMGDYKNAIPDYNEVIRINPALPIPYVNRGIAYANNYQYELAIQDFDKAISIDPEYNEAHRVRGITHAKQKKFDLVIKDWLYIEKKTQKEIVDDICQVGNIIDKKAYRKKLTALAIEKNLLFFAAKPESNKNVDNEVIYLKTSMKK